jgi:hypothetical protein
LDCRAADRKASAYGLASVRRAGPDRVLIPTRSVARRGLSVGGRLIGSSQVGAETLRIRRRLRGGLSRYSGGTFSCGGGILGQDGEFLGRGGVAIAPVRSAEGARCESLSKLGRPKCVPPSIEKLGRGHTVDVHGSDRIPGGRLKALRFARRRFTLLTVG